MVKIHKYYDDILKCEKYEAIVKLGNLGHIAGIGNSEIEAIGWLKTYVDEFLKPLINIDYKYFEYIECQ